MFTDQDASDLNKYINNQLKEKDATLVECVTFLATTFMAFHAMQKIPKEVLNGTLDVMRDTYGEALLEYESLTKTATE